MAEPDITVQAVHVGGPNLPIDRVVIHSTSPTNWSYPATSGPGTAHGTAVYFANPAAGGSAHYVVDIAGEEHCVAENRQAWHAPPNGHSVGIEICASPLYTPDQWLSPAVWPACVAAAARTADLCARHDIPPVKLAAHDLAAGGLGVCGHADVSAAWHETDHTDPGGNFPWPEFMAAVTGHPTPPSQEDLMPNAFYGRRESQPTVHVIGDWLPDAIPVGTFLAVEEQLATQGIKIVDPPATAKIEHHPGDSDGTKRVVWLLDTAGARRFRVP